MLVLIPIYELHAKKIVETRIQTHLPSKRIRRNSAYVTALRPFTGKLISRCKRNTADIYTGSAKKCINTLTKENSTLYNRLSTIYFRQHNNMIYAFTSL